MSALTASLLGFGGSCHGYVEQHELSSADVNQQVQNDGFISAEGVYRGVINAKKGADGLLHTDLKLDLGNCALQVEAGVELDGNNNLTDITKYVFSGYASAERFTRTFNNPTPQQETVIDGTPVEFDFQNRDELETFILGSVPCRTLVESDFIQDR